MKIGVVLATRPTSLPVGGVEEATERLCRGLLRAKLDVTLIAAGEKADKGWAGLRTYRVASSRRRMLFGGAREWQAAVRGALDDVGPDVALAEGLGLAGSAVVRWRGGSRVVVAHGNLDRDYRHAYSWAGWAMRAPLVRAHSVAAVRDADVVVNVTNDWRVNCPVAPARLVHIPNPVADEFYGRDSSPIPGRVVCFGGSQPIKGVDLLLAGWPLVLRDLPWASLELYGYVPGREESLPPACKASAPLGTSGETADAMAHSSVVVLPSRFEVSPLVAAEAMAVGVPIVACDVGGMRAMTGGVAALTKADPVDIAANVVCALRDTSTWVERLREGRRRSLSYRIEAVSRAYVTLFESLLHDGRPSARSR
jgi:glycosyltransferase involved in cell wall biosynthesis